MKPINILPILALTVMLAGAILAEAQQFDFTTLAGSAGGPGDSDGTSSAARFNHPSGLAVDSAGNVYVADTDNHTIRKITQGGVVNMLAGLAGSIGSADGPGSAARFNYPGGVAVDSADNVYVADTSNSTIRKITPAGVTSTLAGLAGTRGSTDGAGSAARFYYPTGVAVDSAGNVYVADQVNPTIRKITPGGVVSTVAGFAQDTDGDGWPDGAYADGTGSAARFNRPYGVAVDSAGIVYVADAGNSAIRKITPDGAVSTLAGLAGSIGSVDGTGSAARFNAPWGVATDSAGNVYVAEWDNHTIRKITPGGVVSTLAGLAGTRGSDDGAGSSARFYYPSAVAVDSAGNVYVADWGNSTIRKITPGGVVSTMAGMAFTTGGGSADGTGNDARFNSPSGVAVDGAGVVYVADADNHTIRMIKPGGVVNTLAGLAQDADGDGFPDGAYADGMTSAARFNRPLGLAVDSTGSVYVADSGNSTIRKITQGGVVSTLAGLAQQDTDGDGFPDGAYADGTGSAARFNHPSGLAVDSAGNVYVADTDNHTIRKITPAGVVSTLAGLAQDTDVDGSPVGPFGAYADGTGSVARFNRPYGVAVDSAGIVYVADTGNTTIRKVTPDGSVSTLAGLAGSDGSDDGTGSAARFGRCRWSCCELICFGPFGVAVDSAGNVYAADTLNHTIRKITPGGVVSTLAGQSGPAYPSADGTGSTARFNRPYGVAVDSSGNLYVADSADNNIRLGTPVRLTQPAFSPNTSLRLSDGQFQVEVTASTNQLVLIQATSVLPTADWITLQTVTLWNGRMTVTDSDASSFPVRFYRAVSPVP